jgi:hypothetical protein
MVIRALERVSTARQSDQHLFQADVSTVREEGHVSIHAASAMKTEWMDVNPTPP